MMQQRHHTFLYVAAGAILLMVSSGTITAAEADLRGFEPPAFEAGSLDGQNGWRVVDVGGKPNDAVVQSEWIFEGNQAVQLKNTGNRIVARFSEAHDDTFYVDAMVMPPAPEAIQSNAALRLRGRDQNNKADILVSVAFNAGGAISGVPRSPGNTYTPAQWTRVTVKVDFESQSWTLWLNGELAGEDLALGGDGSVKQVDTFDLDWTSKPEAAGHGMVVDNFSISTANPLEPS